MDIIRRVRRRLPEQMGTGSTEELLVVTWGESREEPTDFAAVMNMGIYSWLLARAPCTLPLRNLQFTVIDG